jgi:hypothetical protein
MILGELTEEEVQLAASTSYAYWYLDQTGSISPPTSLQTSSAMREVRRHLVASNGNVRKALDRLQEVCQYRKVCTSRLQNSPKMSLCGIAFVDSSLI